MAEAGQGILRTQFVQRLLRLAGILIELRHLGLFVGPGHVEHRGAAASLVVGHEERERFVKAVAPLRNVVAVEAVGGRLLRGSGQGAQLGPAAGGLFAVFVRVVEVGQVGQHAQQAGGHDGARGFEPGAPRAAAHGIDAVGHDDEEHDEEEVVGHLHVVGEHLESREKRRDGAAPEQTAAIAEHEAGDGGRYESQREHFPDVAGRDDDEEIGRKGPGHGAQHGEERAEAEGAHEDVEPQQVEEHVAHDARRAEGIDVGEEAQHVRGLVGRGRLVGGHAAEHGVGPPRLLATLCKILGLLAAEAGGSLIVVTAQREALADGADEVAEADEKQGNDDKGVGPDFLKRFFHVCMT